MCWETTSSVRVPGCGMIWWQCQSLKKINKKLFSSYRLKLTFVSFLLSYWLVFCYNYQDNNCKHEWTTICWPSTFAGSAVQCAFLHDTGAWETWPSYKQWSRKILTPLWYSKSWFCSDLIFFSDFVICELRLIQEYLQKKCFLPVVYIQQLTRFVWAKLPSLNCTSLFSLNLSFPTRPCYIDGLHWNSPTPCD